MASESAGYIADPDEQPFSPSVFLNLPPTPPDDGQDPVVSSDDLVIPFISHILMDDDDKLSYQCPDHQALLQAQQPFAEILSDTTTTTNTNVATSTFTVSPFFPNNAVSAFGTATWPYDPVELSLHLLSRTPYHVPDNVRRTGRDGLTLTTGDHGRANTTFLPEQDNNYTTSVGQFRRQNADKATMDMLNQAFRKGMEEANKFLPTTNMLPIHSEAISGSSREHLSRDRHRIADGQVKEKGIVDGITSSSMLQESGSDSIACKKDHNRWDDLEVEMDRKMADLSIIAVIAPESDQTREKIDKFVLIKYQSLLDKMIAVDMEAEKNANKGKRKSVAVTSNEPAVDLRALLMQCAHAVATGNRLGATELLYKIKQHSSPMGDATQRLAHCYAQALEARLDGMGSQLYNSLMVKQLTSANEFLFLKAYQLCVPASCFKMMAFMFSNLTILKAVAGRARRKKVHIVDYGEHYGFQWPTLLGNWATLQEEGRPLETPVMSTWAVDDSLRIVADYFTQFVMVSEHNETL
ncbi:unnamed protein product [Miscanthus lutarioriparius]|uniref:Uncharacterized protein n=1 Tax=Miscanthus lutarioriparius TaxID=422564 RepID=A0A811Q996_9POAL|nr:unnamed protein product [Miscanthus lutarioriparius]